VLVAWTCECLAAAPVRVLDLAPGPAGTPEVVVISISHSPDDVRIFTLPDPARLVLDISPARLEGPKRSVATSHPLVNGVRAAQFNKQTVRIVLDMKASPGHRIETRAVPDDGRHKLAVIVALEDGEKQAGDGHRSGSRTTPSGQGAEPRGQDAGKVLVFGGDTATERRPEEASRWGKLDLSGFLKVKGAQELHESGYPEQARMARGTGRIEGKWTLPQAGSAPGGETTHVLASLQYDYLGFGPDPSDDDQNLDLFEGYLLHATPGWDLRLGRQIVRWGKTDQISPVDNLNPQDLREFFIPELEDRKLPNWMARIRAFPDDAGPLGGIALEAVFIPFFEQNDFDWTGNTWALLGVEDTGLRINEDEPGQGLENSDYGLRAAATVGGWDLAVSWLAATEKTPRLRLDPFNPKGPTLRGDYGRQNIFGFEFETTLDSFGFRGEAAYFDRQSINTEDFNPASSPVAHWVVGLDYIGEDDWYANIQLSHQHLFEYDEDALFLKRDNFFLNGELNREFWRGNFMLKLRYAVDLHDGGSFITPEAILTYFRNLELSMGANAFFGPKNSLFGRYRDNDQAFLRATWRF
jgi:hypothetical protein